MAFQFHQTSFWDVAGINIAGSHILHVFKLKRKAMCRDLNQTMSKVHFQLSGVAGSMQPVKCDKKTDLAWAQALHSYAMKIKYHIDILSVN